VKYVALFPGVGIQETKVTRRIPQRMDPLMPRIRRMTTTGWTFRE